LRSEELVTLPINHPLFKAAKARLLTKAGRTLGVAAETLIALILRDMSMFAGQPAQKKRRARTSAR
jgi:hypothetical protein